MITEIYALTPNCRSPHLKDRVYWIINEMVDYPVCKTCKKQIIQDIKAFSSTLAKRLHCSPRCRLIDPDFRRESKRKLIERTGYDSPIKNPATREKMRKTTLERYGVEHAFQSEEIKRQIKQTVLEKYGVEHPTKNIDVKAKIAQTFKMRYGVDNPQLVEEFREKARETCLRNYGVENPQHSEEVREKVRQTNLERYGEIYPAHTEKGRATSMRRYGVPHPMQHPEIFKRVLKARFRIKKYISPTGREYYYQGYEDVALKFLLEVNTPEDWIINRVTEVPKITYQSRITGGTSRYYPDIYVKNINLLIEVKSEFTFNINTDITFTKQASSCEAGFNHLILICDKKKVLEGIYGRAKTN